MDITKRKKTARQEFEQMLYDDLDFKKQWGNKSKKGYSEKDFEEWYGSLVNNQ